MGLIWALMSVALVSAAQLTLRAAMTTLPSAQQPLAFLLHLLHFETGTLALLLGLLGYVASMACWFFALKRLPLAKAYALLSLSYMVVWLAAILLPGWHEPFSRDYLCLRPTPRRSLAACASICVLSPS